MNKTLFEGVRVKPIWLRIAFVLGFASLILACSEPTLSQDECDLMLDKPNSEWTEKDMQTFSRDCLEVDASHIEKSMVIPAQVDSSPASDSAEDAKLVVPELDDSGTE